jgi:hypothetical protein
MDDDFAAWYSEWATLVGCQYGPAGQPLTFTRGRGEPQSEAVTWDSCGSPGTLRITHGYNKDHRPDLKQLLWVLTVSADGAVPLHYRVCDGNTNDDPTHIETWDALCKLAGKPDFVYVADSKLWSRQNLDHIHGNGGKFICVLPKSRKEDDWFRRHLQTHPVDWAVALDRTPESDSRPVRDVWLATQSPRRSAEGYRIIWLHSLRGAEHDKSARAAAIKRACDC